ncbi:hypothetical protein NC653_030024 [Populus alba x Populus x berolinensis]|uniref:PGG domain-containing protein n=1 Tax=Populus alba x Populus x berolinensis TaxID=444605 RepID=A0AAD6M698_9ROSI|nr:hypothetical protein NC653_030024 [Populus alba x Populus x berolinensis]
MTPFHHAAIRGRAEVIGLMLSGCPDCIEDETERRENALHLAVRNNRFEAIKMLVDWNREMNKEYLLNKKHEQGNTALHLASWKKTRPGSLEVNALNHTGITALDDRNSTSEARGTLLDIAVLVATATFIVVVNPPGGLGQDTSIPDQKNITSSNTAHFCRYVRARIVVFSPSQTVS